MWKSKLITFILPKNPKRCFEHVQMTPIQSVPASHRPFGYRLSAYRHLLLHSGYITYIDDVSMLTSEDSQDTSFFSFEQPTNDKK